ncbi:MAG: ABC transporter ATP-binding protein [Rubrobacter sp.]|nr:ABC transporter ATP-binding protein [Rubrobacter sp.]
MQGAALEASNITRLYKGTGRGVSDVSFSVSPGEIYGLMGPNGSGKSTLLRILTTSISPDSGGFSVFGDDARESTRKVRSRMGLMVDKPTHYGDLSGWVNAYLFARLYGLEEKKAEAALAGLFEYFDLYDYRHDRAKAYSYGMGKKLALIEALAHGPDFLLLDEPSLGLDYTSQLAYQRKVREFADGGAAVLVASNQVEEVESLCDRVGFLHGGKLAAEGTPQELISSVGGVRRIVSTLRNPVEYGPVEEVEGVRMAFTEGRDLVVQCSERRGIVADVVGAIVECGGDIVDLHVLQPSLEDVYVKLTGEALKRED